MMGQEEIQKPIGWVAGLILVLIVLGLAAAIIWLLYTNPKALGFVYDIINSIPGLSVAIP